MWIGNLSHEKITLTDGEKYRWASWMEQQSHRVKLHSDAMPAVTVEIVDRIVGSRFGPR